MLNKLHPSVLKPFLRLIQGPLVTPLFDLQEQTRQTIQRLLDDDRSGGSASQCVVVEAIGNTDIPPQDRTSERLLDEEVIFGFAGTETVSRAMAAGSFYLFNDKSILARLRDELAAATAKSPNTELTLGELEKLPYLVLKSILI